MSRGGGSLRVDKKVQYLVAQCGYDSNSCFRGESMGRAVQIDYLRACFTHNRDGVAIPMVWSFPDTNTWRPRTAGSSRAPGATRRTG